ncbi:Alpha/Beta hydrolase protein [Fomitopsis serialis]|uniref:Alpha/Beta hydrolase protein n=1 Tax=Fomitopsis serialis TaxID=139415 RepID=UPI0020075CD7|nr:Alpha/Beta hydrolase protein [Neoantrodia serialis]KAH9929352.1 Alpha/Beta hydrolase protein [Neoantrodia serialis]
MHRTFATTSLSDMSTSFKPISKVVASSDGMPIYAEAIGDPSKPALIMAHGMALSAATFDDVFFDKRMLNEVYMVRYDLRGHGRSGKPTNPEAYVSSVWADDYTAVMQAFNIGKHVFLGWSYGATVACDICANISPNPLAGIAWMTPLPYVGPIMGAVGTPVILGFLPGLVSATDVALHVSTKIAFVDSLVNDPAALDFKLKTSMIGQAMLHPPEVAQLITTRPQDPAKLFEAGQQGVPLLLLHGTADTQVKGAVVEKEIGPHFKDFEVREIEGGCHALPLEYLDEVVESLLKFVKRVVVRESELSHFTGSDYDL